MKKATLITALGLGLIFVSGQNAFAQINQEQAKQIALQHAGLNQNQIQQLLVKQDFDDGKQVFDVQFRQGRTEFDYEIDINTGNIISFEKDIDDND